MKTKLSAEAYRKKWGIPDWRDGKAYPKGLLPKQWRWEFLRRSNNYREDWLRAHAATVKWYREYGPEEVFSKAFAPCISPCPDGVVHMQNWEVSSINPRFRVQMPGSQEKYNMKTLCDPANAQPDLGESYWDSYSIYLFEPAMKNSLLPRAPLALALDPGISTAAHIKLLRQGLERLRQKSEARRKRSNIWAEYLRVLDARAEGTTYLAIGRVLRPDLIYSEAAARAEEQYKAAKRLQMNIQKYPK
jgi:hypothetical protein